MYDLRAEGPALDDSSSHGFSIQLIEDITWPSMVSGWGRRPLCFWPAPLFADLANKKNKRNPTCHLQKPEILKLVIQWIRWSLTSKSFFIVWFMDSVVTSISERIDGIIKDVAQLKASLDLTWKNHVNELSKTVVNFPNKGTMLMLLYLLCFTIPLFTPFLLMVFKFGVSHTQPTYLFLPCCPTSSWVRCAFLICKQNMLRSYAHVLHFLQSSEWNDQFDGV